MLNRVDRALRRLRFLRPAFHPTKSGERHMCPLREFALIKPEQGSGGTDLVGGDHAIYLSI